MASVYIRRKDTERPRVESHVKVEARTGVMLTQAQNARKYLKLEEGRKESALEYWRECGTTDFRLLASRV
jgi:hypothetical protein